MTSEQKQPGMQAQGLEPKRPDETINGPKPDRTEADHVRGGLVAR